MKIGILTFHASHNYGSMLQAYALQHFLHQKGYEVETINLRIIEQRRLYKFPLIPMKGLMRRYIKSMLNPLWLFHECKKWIRYEEFLEKYIKKSSKEYGSWEEIKKDLPILGYQCIITGSDQIWNMKSHDFDISYFLPDRLLSIKKVAYSPSFGDLLSEITNERERFIKGCVSEYSCISVREKSMKDYLEKLLHREVELVLDPTLLLYSNDYESIITKEPLIKGDYIFYYTPGVNFALEEFALKISDHMGLTIVTSFPRILRKKNFVSVYEAGPLEFLNLVKNAKFVIGKSFHLIAFSVLFHKEFIAIDGNSDSRMKSFLSLLSLSERGMVNENNYKTISLRNIDFDQVDRIIEEMRNHSRDFLIKSLNT